MPKFDSQQKQKMFLFFLRLEILGERSVPCSMSTKDFLLGVKGEGEADH
jgi:hypothetical protein